MENKQGLWKRAYKEPDCESKRTFDAVVFDNRVKALSVFISVYLWLVVFPLRSPRLAILVLLRELRGEIPLCPCPFVAEQSAT